jgi:hypothetical protein
MMVSGNCKLHPFTYNPNYGDKLQLRSTGVSYSHELLLGITVGRLALQENNARWILEELLLPLTFHQRKSYESFHGRASLKKVRKKFVRR